ncbi:hypothetical protein HCJ93_08255 [Streptomyces sp. SBST2-5]|uniref:Uncharacterized protein n=1 Tax=Streptomyces composti TaxID=2720025 RepID=A0ABX1A997_9ACTN|nr:hypothetical protein [Streptomyces composti]NJP50063.1 hypothetical protein [Streptomyces composti]
MTDTPDSVDVDVEAEGWDEPQATYPEFPANPHNHRYTISMNAQGPMLVIRANTGEEIKAASEELEDAAVGAAIGRAWSAFKAGAALGNGLGATPVQGPPAAPQAPTPPPFGPNVSVPQAPGYQGPPVPPPPPPAPAAHNNAAEFSQAGWYRLNVPFKQKSTFDGIVAQYQLRKGRPSEGGQVSFNKADKSWYVDPQYAGAFSQFNPVPA